ncbi:methyltransferase domain-containing protein [Ramlibacter albus]|uniref:Methyltransferase domain-containing protein n=1 Tax=Ramlibacter albus TaxID=2079448 RepID=A0A923S2S1_9BURK|nr:methyltransferase domain-containing protein [Ramlibacter albus]MBC5765068.1 methyltransferase domain-containing protein [Ramlibacter albus]
MNTGGRLKVRKLIAQGSADFNAGRFAEAERSFAQAVALAPADTIALGSLAATLMKLGRAADALAVSDKVLAREPGNISSLGLRALALAELGRRPGALEAFDRALAADPKAGTLWLYRGNLLVELKQEAEAAESFEKAIAHGGDKELAQYFLRALRGESVDDMPRAFVENLFDKYAVRFDEHLVQALNYQAPAVLAQHLATLDRRFERVLDLGCGTGLVGRIAKAIMLHIEGVDLSMGMLQKAAESGTYEKLVHGDIVEYLRGAQGPYDLVVCADVLVYVGALEEVFSHVARCLEPGGVFALTIEDAGPGVEKMVLRPSRRFAHAEGYVLDLASRNGLQVQAMQKGALRTESEAPMPGIYFWLVRSA